MYKQRLIENEIYFKYIIKMNDPVFHYFGNKAGVEGAD